LIGRSCIEARLRRPGMGAALDRLETLPIRYEWLGVATAQVDEEGLAAIPDDPGPVRPALDLIEHERGVHMFRVDPHDGSMRPHRILSNTGAAAAGSRHMGSPRVPCRDGDRRT